jgi:hypothetical protein
MKSILLLMAGLLTWSFGLAQYNILDEDLTSANSPYTDQTQPGWTTTYVLFDTWRRDPAGVTYNHIHPIFSVTGAWLTQFNDGPVPLIFAAVGNNIDYFAFQGDNKIEGEEGVIVFDDVYFNNGAGNLMEITNFNSGIHNAEHQFGQIPGSILIAKNIFFNNGITTTSEDKPVTGAIVFINDASYTGGLPDAHHVNGFVTEVNYETSVRTPGHGGDFTFPVGNGSKVYQLRRQGTFDVTDSTLTVGWVNLDPNLATTIDPTQGAHNITTDLPAPVAAIIKAGFWDWHYQSANATTSDQLRGAMAMAESQTITASIPDLSDYTGLLPSDLRLIGYDPQNFKWIDLSSGSGLPFPYASGLTKGSLLTGVIPAGQLITAIAIGSTNNVILPVSFISFNVKADGCKALLEWQTGSEQNNSHFVVERSTNGNDFTAIGRVGATGNSNSLNTYRFTDEAPAGGINYYRITQVDFDGKRSSTGIKAIRIQCDGNAVTIKAYPNPATSQINIQSGKAVAQVNVVASNGTTVMKYLPSQNQGGTFSLNIQQVQKGIYLLQVVNKDGTIDVIKLLKQ